MTGLAIAAFRGTVPRVSERLIGGNQAQQALNCKITSGRLDPLKGLGLVHTSVLAAITTMYRYRHLETYNWLVWSRVVDVARSPVARDTLGRIYFCGDGEPRMTTYADAVTGSVYPNAWFVLGVVSPVTAMTINVVGGAGANEDRAYVYTFRTRYGEESGPSPATLRTGRVDGSWDITGLDAAPPNTGTISAAVRDTPLPGQVEVTLNTVFGIASGEELTIAGVAGMTDLNGKFKLVSVDSATMKVVVNLTTAQTYSAAADTWARVAPHNLTGMTKCIYRTVGTNVDYRLVAEIPAANTTYSDTVPATTVSKNAGISTLDTLPPPKEMHSIVLLANGVTAGLSGNQLCLSEQGKPYSWPIGNRYSFPGTGVALCAAGNAVIVLTDSYPLVATATVPEAATLTKIPGDTLAPCVAKQGAVDIGSGSLYPSHDGLYVATTGGVRNLTEALFTFDEWQLLMPATFKAGFHAGAYYAMHDTADQPSMFMMHTKESDSVVQFNEQVDAVYSNPWDGRLYVGKGNLISQWDSDDNKRYTSSWRSKEFQLARSVNLSVAQVHAKWEDLGVHDSSILEANEALMANVNNVNGEIGCFEVGDREIGSSLILPVPDQSAPSVQFTLIRDGAPVHTEQVTDSTPFRLPGNEKSDLYAVQISTTIPVYSINAAQGMAELKQSSV
jgi:hypothetical protein